MKLVLWSAIPVAAVALGFAMAPEARTTRAKTVTKAVAVVHPAKDQKVSGVVRFEKAEGGLKISWELSGLAPGNHGFHIHEFGDCNCADLKCAGGHFNPDGKKHGGPGKPERHAGDLGNIVAGADGTSKGEMTDSGVALQGDRSIVGRAIMIHEKEDDLATDPTGNAGGRFAAGVIGIAKEE